MGGQLGLQLGDAGGLGRLSLCEGHHLPDFEGELLAAGCKGTSVSLIHNNIVRSDHFHCEFEVLEVVALPSHDGRHLLVHEGQSESLNDHLVAAAFAVDEQHGRLTGHPELLGEGGLRGKAAEEEGDRLVGVLFHQPVDLVLKFLAVSEQEHANILGVLAIALVVGLGDQGHRGSLLGLLVLIIDPLVEEVGRVRMPSLVQYEFGGVLVASGVVDQPRQLVAGARGGVRGAVEFAGHPLLEALAGCLLELFVVVDRVAAVALVEQHY